MKYVIQCSLFHRLNAWHVWQKNSNKVSKATSAVISKHLINVLTENVYQYCTEYYNVFLGLWVLVVYFLSAAQRRLEELQNAIGSAEQQVLKVTGELQQLEDALAQKKVCKEIAMWIARESSIDGENRTGFLPFFFIRAIIYM